MVFKNKLSFVSTHVLFNQDEKVKGLTMNNSVRLGNWGQCWSLGGWEKWYCLYS